MKELVHFPENNVYLNVFLMNKDIDKANENFDELEERVDALSGAIDNLTISIIGLESLNFSFKHNYDHIKALEERVDNLEEALTGLARGVIGAEDIMRDIRFVLMGYSEGENTYAEGEV